GARLGGRRSMTAPPCFLRLYGLARRFWPVVLRNGSARIGPRLLPLPVGPLLLVKPLIERLKFLPHHPLFKLKPLLAQIGADFLPDFLLPLRLPVLVRIQVDHRRYALAGKRHVIGMLNI